MKKNRNKYISLAAVLLTTLVTLFPIKVNAAQLHSLTINSNGQVLTEKEVETGHFVKIKFSDTNVDISDELEYDTIYESDCVYYEFKMPDKDLTFSINKNKKTLLIGDSRTVGMYMATSGSQKLLTDNRTTVIGQEDNIYWICKVGAGLSWMKDHVDDGNAFLEKGTDIYILMGVNDCKNHGSADQYAEFINEKARVWEEEGMNVIFVSVNPISSDTCYSTSNTDVQYFNETIKDELDPSIKYLSTYDSMSGNISYANDGLHYNSSTYKDLYELILGSSHE